MAIERRLDTSSFAASAAVVTLSLAGSPASSRGSAGSAGVARRALRPSSPPASGVRGLVGTNHRADASLVSTSSSSACSTRPSMMCEPDPVLHRVERRADLRQHPAVDQPSANSASISLAVSPVNRCPSVQHAGRVVISTSLGAQRLGELAGDQVGVDVVRLALVADADRRDDRMKSRVSRSAISPGRCARSRPRSDVDVLADWPSRSIICAPG